MAASYRVDVISKLAAFLKRIFSRPEAETVAPAASDANLQIVNASADVIMRIGPDMRAEYVSPSALEILGYLPEEIIGHGPHEFVYPEDLPLVVQDSQLHLDGKKENSALTHRMLRKDGSVIWVECRNRPILDPKTLQPAGFVLVMRDITLQKGLQDQLHRLALTDGLTGLANRRAFDEAIAREWTCTLRQSTQMSLLLIDIDHFKRFNDQYGHQVGDDCVRAVAAAIARAVRQPGDLAARYGGDEFAIILAGTDSAGATEMANLIIQHVRELRLPHQGNPEGGGYVTTSIGAATALCRVGGTIEMPQSLLAAADNALYKAKHNGRDRVATSLLLAQGDG
jgi:diguanylate cyclase (GGDEF)-like protein/PAS domain S-box-containing protein